MISNDGGIGLMFIVLAAITLIAIGAVVTYSFDLAALLPASVRTQEPAAAGRTFPSGVTVAEPGSSAERVPYPVVNVGEAQTVFPQEPPLPSV